MTRTIDLAPVDTGRCVTKPGIVGSKSKPVVPTAHGHRPGDRLRALRDDVFEGRRIKTWQRMRYAYLLLTSGWRAQRAIRHRAH